MLFLLLACQSPKESAPNPADSSLTNDSQTTQTDSETTTETTETTSRELVGQAPSNPVPLPEFVATNMDESPRSRDDLLGHRTIIWFYPAASTAG